MRLLINVNQLPPQCDTTGLTLVNVHWHPTVDHWTQDLPTSRRFVIEAFSNEVKARAFMGPLFLDIEPPALSGVWGKRAHHWLNIHADAIQRTREVLPGREVFAMDPVIGNDPQQATENITAAESMLRMLDGVSVSFYPKGDNTFEARNAPTLDALFRLRDAKSTSNRRLQVGIAINDMAGGVQCSLDTFRESIEYGKSRGVDFIIFWQAVRYYGGEVGAASRIQPFIECFREAATP